jgi:hypothetical protein
MRSQGRFSPRFTRRVCLRAVCFSLGVIRQPVGFDPVSREYDTAVVTDSPSYKKKKKCLFGEDNSRLLLEASSFLNTKGVLEKMDNYNIIRIFRSHEKPLFLPYYVSDKLFIIEVVIQIMLRMK